MKLVEINWNPGPRQLRQFGWVALAALPALGWLWSGGRWTVVLPLAAAGGATAGLGLWAPRRLKPLFVAVSLVTLPVGLVVAELTTVLLFFGVFVPLGLLMRLFRRDSLQRRLAPDADSYWQPKSQPAGIAGYFRQW